METEWKYSGDISLEYGGYYYRHDVNNNGFTYYTDVIRITDLDFGAGADGLTMIENINTFGFDDKPRVKSCLDCIGMNPSDLRRMGKENILAVLTDAFLSYGYYDPTEDDIRPSSWIVVNDNYSVCSDKRGWDGWKINRDETVKVCTKFMESEVEQYIDN